MTLSDGMELYAASPGRWGGSLTATIDYQTAFESDAHIFNLTITDTSQPAAAPQTYSNVTFDRINPNGGYLPNVLTSHSDAWVRVKDVVSGGVTPEPPVATARMPPAFSGGSDGDGLADNDIVPSSGQMSKSGIYALDDIDMFNLLVIPPYVNPEPQTNNPQDVPTSVVAAAVAYCRSRKAFLLIDPPSDWSHPAGTASDIQGKGGLPALFQVRNEDSANAAVFYPRLLEINPATGHTEMFAPSGAIAGIFAASDAQRGVWSAPVGTSTTLANGVDMEIRLTDTESGLLNPWAVNCIRVLPLYGPVVWGSRTLQGADVLASQWKYIPVRRLALFLELSLYRGTQWAVFEPNDEPLWGQIRMNISAFMNDLFRQGAFAGMSGKDAYFVKCDSETTTQTDIGDGILNIVVGFAPLKPSEFVVITVQLTMGPAGA